MRITSMLVCLGVVGLAACGQRGATSLPLEASSLRAPAAEPAAGTYAVIRRYRTRVDGQDPQSPLLAYGGSLYGLVGGGKHNYGTAFEMMPSGTGWSQTDLFAFADVASGAGPWYGMVRDAQGALYGTTVGGGDPSCQCGVVYKLAKVASTWKETAIYSFHGEQDHDGGNPLPLIIDASGNLFGMASYGGTGSCVAGSDNTGCGYVYELSPSGGAYKKTVLYNFKGGKDGEYPTAALLAGPGGVLYGTTQRGGTTSKTCYLCGVVFRLAPAAKSYVETVLYRFKGGADGYSPLGRLSFGDTPASASTIFGTTLTGGVGVGNCAPYTTACGTIFSLTLSGATAKKTILHSFLGGAADGSAPYGGVLAIGTNLYVTTESGGDVGATGLGTLSRVSVSGTKYALLHLFLGGTDGDTPNSELTLLDGSIFGTTLQGGKGTCGPYGCGTIFEYTL